MIKKSFLMMALVVMCMTEVKPQCSDISVGTYDGTPLLGNANTPFPTNTGSNDLRGARRQYIYPASELLAAGVCPGPISRITFYGLGSEYPCDPFVTCPDLKVDLRIGNSSLADFGPYVASQSTPLPVDWDAPTEASAQMNTFSLIPMVTDTGMIHFQLMGAGFNWNGGSNLVLDISWQRAASNGTSPPVQLMEDLPYTACKWVQVTGGSNVSHGNTYQDNPLTANATTGTTFNRPVTTFNSTAEVALAISDNAVAAQFRTYYDPATGDAVVTRTNSGDSELTVMCSDITGRTLAQRIFPSGTGTLRIPIKEDYQGMVVMFGMRSDGGRVDLGRISSIR